jgi:pimeloyl-ACP methyl ester carboxylesterase
LNSAIETSLLQVGQEFELRRKGALLNAYCTEPSGLPADFLHPLIEKALACGLCRDDGHARQLLHVGREIMAAQGVSYTAGRAPTLFDRVLLESIFDALPHEGMEHAASNAIPAQILHSDADWMTTPSGTRYYLQPGKGRPFFIVNALGIPLRIWSPFLTLAPAAIRLCIVDQAPNDSFFGGMSSSASYPHYAERICDVLAHTGLFDSCLLGWSNGARIALHAASMAPHAVSKVVLLSPTLRSAGHRAPRSRIEDSLDRAFRAVIRSPDIAPAISGLLRKSPDQIEIAPGPAASVSQDWDAFFSLARSDQIRDLACPVNSGASLLHYARRTLADETADLEPILHSLKATVVLVQGESDDVVNNHVAVEALCSLPPYTRVLISGAGHYIHALQVRYLWNIITGLLESRQVASMRTTTTEVS